MADKKAEKQAEADSAPEKEQEPLLDDEGVAVSPLDNYPGQIVFPVPPKGKHYRLLMESTKRREGDLENDILKLIPHWRAVTELADVQIEGVDSLDFDDVPTDVVRWSVRVLNEYTVNFLLRAL